MGTSGLMMTSLMCYCTNIWLPSHRIKQHKLYYRIPCSN